MAQKPIPMFPGCSAMNIPRIPANMGNPGAGCLPLRALGGSVSLDKLESLELDAVEAEMIAADEKREAEMGNLRNGCPIGMTRVEENTFEESLPSNYSRHRRDRGSARTERFTVHDGPSGSEDESTNSYSSDYSEESFMDESEERMETSERSSVSIRSPDSVFNRTTRDSVDLYVDLTSQSGSPATENNSTATGIDVDVEEISETLEDPETPLPPASSAPIRRTQAVDRIDVEAEPMELESHAVLDVTPEGQGTPLPSTSAPIRTLSTNPRRFRPAASPHVTPTPADDEHSRRFRRVRFNTIVRTLRDADFEDSDDELN